MIVRGDGTYDEQVHLKTGQMKNVENERWAYDTRTKRMHFSKLLVSPETSFEVEPSVPAVIFINRATGCQYGRPKEP